MFEYGSELTQGVNLMTMRKLSDKQQRARKKYQALTEKMNRDAADFAWIHDRDLEDASSGYDASEPSGVIERTYSGLLVIFRWGAHVLACRPVVYRTPTDFVRVYRDDLAELVRLGREAGLAVYLPPPPLRKPKTLPTAPPPPQPMIVVIEPFDPETATREFIEFARGLHPRLTLNYLYKTLGQDFPEIRTLTDLAQAYAQAVAEYRNQSTVELKAKIVIANQFAGFAPDRFLS